jgi:PadR family transcriptional regulator, regulatory protein AphA
MATSRDTSDELEAAGLGSPAYVVLGMVRLGARSGYEIKQMVDLSIRFFWTISQVQIYPALQQLEDKGLVIGRDEPRGRRRRRLYEITAAGERVLRDWVAWPGPLPFELRDIAMVRLFFADAVDQGAALRLLEDVRGRSEERVATLRAIEPTAEAADADGNRFPSLTLQMGIAFHQAMVDVCAEFERKVRGAGGAAPLPAGAPTPGA